MMTKRGVVPESTAMALGMHRYQDRHPGAEAFVRFYDATVEYLESLDERPTHIGAEGEGYSGKFTKFGSRTHKKLLETHMTGIGVLSLATAPPGSDAPAFDSYFSMSLTYVQSTGEVLCCACLNEGLVPLGSVPFHRLLERVSVLARWDFGYAFAGDVSSRPEFHVLGLDNGTLTDRERAALEVWYSAPRDSRLARLRDLYPFNIVRTEMLKRELAGGISLKDYLVQNPGVAITPLTEEGLWLVDVREDVRLKLRAELQRLGGLV